MDALKTILENFNRFYLRYFPATICIFFFIATWLGFYFYEVRGVHDGLLEFIKDHPIYSAAALFVVSGGLSIILTWPMLLLHVYRFDVKEVVYLSKNREQGEITDTIRHTREYGSNMINVGTCILQLYFLLSEYLHTDRIEKLGLIIIVLSLISILVGISVWKRGVDIEIQSLKNLRTIVPEGEEPKKFTITIPICIKRIFPTLIVIAVSAGLISMSYMHDDCTLFAQDEGACFRDPKQKINEFNIDLACNLIYSSQRLPLVDENLFIGCLSHYDRKRFLGKRVSN